MKYEKQIETLTSKLQSQKKQIKELNDKYQETLANNFKSQRTQDLEPMFKPIHSKTMSLVGMLKQYATGGPGASQETTERKGPRGFRGGSPNVRDFDAQSLGREGENGELKKAESLQIVSDLDEEFDSEFGNDLGLKELAPPDLPREPV